jgi:hypothetical protein
MFKYTIRFRCKSKRFYILFMSLHQYFLALAFIYYSVIEINHWERVDFYFSLGSSSWFIIIRKSIECSVLCWFLMLSKSFFFVFLVHCFTNSTSWSWKSFNWNKWNWITWWSNMVTRKFRSFKSKSFT